MSCEFTPHMSADEVALLAEVIPAKADILEFGCGGSTQLFFEREAKNVVSIDSDKLWLEKLLTNPVVFIHHKHGRWHPLHADIGRVRDWGMPYIRTPRTCWFNYHQYCWDRFSKRDFDLILIDGRFRVACVCQSLLRCNNPEALFVVHDFWNRPNYHIILDFLDIIHRKDSLGIFRPKTKIDWRKVNLVLQAHQFSCE